MTFPRKQLKQNIILVVSHGYDGEEVVAPHLLSNVANFHELFDGAKRAEVRKRRWTVSGVRNHFAIPRAIIAACSHLFSRVLATVPRSLRIN